MIRGLLEQIPPDEYPKIVQEAEELTRAIEADPSLYEPIHCVHGHGAERRTGRYAGEVYDSQHIVKSIALRTAKHMDVLNTLLERVGKVAIAAMAAHLVWCWAECGFWWF